MIEIAGVDVVRVRHHGNLARIEVGLSERRKMFDEGKLDAIHARLKAVGYTYITLDFAGYRTGSMNTSNTDHT